MKFADDLQRVLDLPGPPQRIVSLVPSLTETLFALGAGESLVGVTRYCTHPPEKVRHLPKVGGTKNPEIEKILALKPDLVLLNAEENRREDFARLEEEGLALYVTFPHTVEEGIALVERLGEVVGVGALARQMGRALRQAYQEVTLRVEEEGRLRVFCPIWRKPWMSFNRDTYVDHMLWCSGGENVFRQRPERFFSVTLEEVALLSPEVILLPDEPYPFSSRHLRYFKPLAHTPAGRGGHIYCIDGKALSWYGPRISEGLRSLWQIFSRVRASREESRI